MFCEQGPMASSVGVMPMHSADTIQCPPLSREEELQAVVSQLKRTQQQLLVQQKLASLGALTAGIAHEIRNPLNFVVNLSEFSIELLEELFQLLEVYKGRIGPDAYPDFEYLIADIRKKLQKAAEHGKRADSIVKGMLDHSRGGAGQRECANLNALVAEYVNLAYHGMRAQDPRFNADVQTSYDPLIGAISMIPQDLSRVILNIANNACYAVNEKRQRLGLAFAPEISVTTCDLGGWAEIRVRDNGGGMPPEVSAHAFEPFFTTKPAGQGTGLGLSISYDIVVHQHQGELVINTEPDQYTEIIIRLPKEPAVAAR